MAQNSDRAWWKRSDRRRKTDLHDHYRPEKGWRVEDEKGMAKAFKKTQEEAERVAAVLRERFKGKVFTVVEEDPSK